jgi:hypothetical protein
MPLEAQMFGGKEQDWEQLAGLRESPMNGFARRRDKGTGGTRHDQKRS